MTELSYGGDTLAVLVRLRDGSVLRVVRGLADGLAAGEVSVGDSVRVHWQPDACILLPP